MLSNIKKTTVIECNNIKEKEILIKYLEGNNIENRSSNNDSNSKLYCILYVNDKDKFFHFFWGNPDSDYDIISYSDIIKPNPLSLLESKLKELLLNPNICFKLDTVEEKISMNKLMVELGLKWASKKSFETQSIHSIMRINSYFIPFSEGGSKILSNIENRKVISFKDILKEIKLEELNNKNNNNN